MAMMAIAAVYEPYQVRRLNHGIGYATAAIELAVNGDTTSKFRTSTDALCRPSHRTRHSA
jgi:Malonate decarboxylase, alpha subunit, transporter